MKKVTKAQIKKATEAVMVSMKNTRRKLFVLEVLQSAWEVQNGKGKIYDSVDDLIEHITNKIKTRKK